MRLALSRLVCVALVAVSGMLTACAVSHARVIEAMPPEDQMVIASPASTDAQDDIPKIDWTGLGKSDDVSGGREERLYEYFQAVAGKESGGFGFATYFSVLDFFGDAAEKVNAYYVRLSYVLNPGY